MSREIEIEYEEDFCNCYCDGTLLHHTTKNIIEDHNGLKPANDNNHNLISK